MMPKNWNYFSLKLTVFASIVFVSWLGWGLAACGNATVPLTAKEKPLPLASDSESPQSKTEDLMSADDQFGLQAGLPYAAARELLMQQGWQPHLQGAAPNLSSPTVSELLDLGYEEVKDCASTGMGLCRFEFINEAGDLLVVSTVTLGSDRNDERVVWTWFVEERLPMTQPGSSFPEPNPSSSNRVDPAQIQLSLAGIAPGDTEAEVFNRLGPPNRVIDSIFPRLEYPGMTVWLDENRQVVEIISTNAEDCTPDGVCPDMAFADVRALYGEPIVNDRENGRFMEYYSPGATCWLQIALDEQTVESVGVVCQP